MTNNTVRAWFLGERIDVRGLDSAVPLASVPLMVRVGEGYAVVFRFGAVALFFVDEAAEKEFLARIAPRVSAPLQVPELESTEVRSGAAVDAIDARGVLELVDRSPGRLLVVAEVLCKSAVLSHHESSVALALQHVEDLAERLRRGGRGWTRTRDLLQRIGDVLLMQTRTVGRFALTEKPEITWDAPELDRFYEKLALEYELRERDRVLERKLEIVARTAETYLELVQNRRSLRVEWYIVLLIVVEIAIYLWELRGIAGR